MNLGMMQDLASYAWAKLEAGAGRYNELCTDYAIAHRQSLARWPGRIAFKRHGFQVSSQYTNMFHCNLEEKSHMGCFRYPKNKE